MFRYFVKRLLATIPVMAVVDPEERAAAASVTHVPRSLASAVPPLLAGLMLAQTTFGWPLIIGGALKAAYDLALVRLFHDVRPPEELEQVAPENTPATDALVARFLERGKKMGQPGRDLSAYWRWVLHTLGPDIESAYGSYELVGTDLVPVDFIRRAGA